MRQRKRSPVRMASLVELRHFRYFVAVAERRHFTQAAAELGIAQPALSAQIRQLESLFGVVLFERTNRSVRLTPAGETLFTHAKAILAGVAGAEAAMHEYAADIRGNLAIGALPVLGEILFPRLIADLASTHPEVSVSLREDRNERLLEDLRCGELQAAIIDLSGLEDAALAGIETRDLFRSPLVVAMTVNHPLAHRSSIHLGELRGERFIHFSGGSDVRHRRFAAIAKDAAVDITPSFVVTQSSLVRSLAADGNGVALSPQWFALLAGPPVAAPVLADDRTGFRIAFAWKSLGRSPLTNVLLGLLERYAVDGTPTPRRSS